MGKITIDIDNAVNKIEFTRECLRECIPCTVRISASGVGIHVLKIGEDGEIWKLKKKYDDLMRYKADKFRKKVGLLNNFLFDMKWYNGVKKYAGQWVDVENENDIQKFLKEMIKND